MFPYLVAAIVIIGLPTIYIAVRFREYRKFLAGAFFVSSGMQIYFYLAKIPIPLMRDECNSIARTQWRAWDDTLCAFLDLSLFRLVLPPQSPRRLRRSAISFISDWENSGTDREVERLHLFNQMVFGAVGPCQLL